MDWGQIAGYLATLLIGLASGWALWGRATHITQDAGKLLEDIGIFLSDASEEGKGLSKKEVTQLYQDITDVLNAIKGKE